VRNIRYREGLKTTTANQLPELTRQRDKLRGEVTQLTQRRSWLLAENSSIRTRRDQASKAFQLARAKLEPYLGFLHSNQMSKRSLICDFQELYRYLIDDFLIGYCQRINKMDFTVKTEVVNRRRTGKREVLSKSETGEILRDLNRFFETMVEVKRIRNGEHQTLETLINEEAQLFAKYLRGENKNWVPRIPGIQYK